MAPMEMRLVLSTFVAKRQIVAGEPAGPDVRYGTLVGPPEGLTIRFESL